jgi:hypothetical protein
MIKGEIKAPVRGGKPERCIVCAGELHRKSEYYCSLKCAEQHKAATGRDDLLFLSKWKIRKRRETEDPLVRIRAKIRKRTATLIKKRRLRKGPCVVCGLRNVLAHHEDYSNAYRVIWLCEEHHKQYHNGEIALFKGRLKWDPARLTRIRGDVKYPREK